MLGRDTLEALAVASLLLSHPTTPAEDLGMKLNESQEQFLIAQTVALEAEGEPYEGKLAVAYVIMNRSKVRKQNISEVIYTPYQFSAYNTRGGRAQDLDSIPPRVWQDSMRAAASAYYGIEEDPTEGSLHYMNEGLVIATRGSMPRWALSFVPIVKIGLHTFYKEAK